MENRSIELKSFIKLNKQSREKRAKKLGFVSADAYRNYLEGKTPVAVPETPKTTGGTKSKKASASKPSSVGVVIHIVDILDRSGSMTGGKIKAAAQGINKGIDNLKKGEEGVRYTYTFCEFSDRKFVKVYPVRDMATAKHIDVATYGSTALYDAIGKTIDEVKDRVKEGEKVLVNIYTDGQENDSRKFKAADIKKMIDDYSLKGYTFTFIGTERDVQYVNTHLNIDMSNTLVFDGSAQDLERGMNVTQTARTVYVNNVKAGNDVSKGFYKNVVKK